MCLTGFEHERKIMKRHIISALFLLASIQTAFAQYDFLRPVKDLNTTDKPVFRGFRYRESSFRLWKFLYRIAFLPLGVEVVIPFQRNDDSDTDLQKTG